MSIRVTNPPVGGGGGGGVPADGSVTTAKLANAAVTPEKAAASLATQAELDAVAAQAVGGVLGGSLPSPGFAVDMATQGELDAVANLKTNETTRAASGKGFVNHGATASTSRPTGYASVEWVGSVSPTNAIDGDTWISTA